MWDMTQTYVALGAVAVSITGALIYGLWQLRLRRTGTDFIFRDIAEAYKLRFIASDRSGHPEVAGVIDGAYLRIRVAKGQEFGDPVSGETIVASLVFELPVSGHLEIRRGEDFRNWKTPMPSGAVALNGPEWDDSLSIYGSREDASQLLVMSLQEKLVELFQGDGEWRFHIARRDGELMWRSSDNAMSKQKLFRVIDAMIRIEAVIFDNAEEDKAA